MPTQKVTKEEILQKAARIIYVSGYKDTSMADLAKACGVLKGSFYHHFASKEILVKEVLSYTHQFFREKIFAKAYNLAYPVESRLAKMLDIHYNIVKESLQGCLFGNIGLETDHLQTEFQEIVLEFFGDWRDAFAHLWQEKYQLPTEEAYKRARLWIAQVEGGAMLMKIYKDPLLLAEVMENIKNNF